MLDGGAIDDVGFRDKGRACYGRGRLVHPDILWFMLEMITVLAYFGDALKAAVSRHRRYGSGVLTGWSERRQWLSHVNYTQNSEKLCALKR